MKKIAWALFVGLWPLFLSLLAQDDVESQVPVSDSGQQLKIDDQFIKKLEVSSAQKLITILNGKGCEQLKKELNALSEEERKKALITKSTTLYQSCLKEEILIETARQQLDTMNKLECENVRKKLNGTIEEDRKKLLLNQGKKLLQQCSDESSEVAKARQRIELLNKIYCPSVKSIHNKKSEEDRKKQLMGLSGKQMLGQCQNEEKEHRKALSIFLSKLNNCPVVKETLDKNDLNNLVNKKVIIENCEKEMQGKRLVDQKRDEGKKIEKGGDNNKKETAGKGKKE